MLKIVRLLPLVFLCAVSQAQTTYTYTLPTIQGSQLNSWVDFSFPNATATTGGGTLTFGWLACWQQVFGNSSKIWIELETGVDTYTQVYYETGNVTECVMFNRTANVNTTVLTNAIATGGGAINGHVRVEDSCYPGVGCSNFNDPLVSGLTLKYLTHAANFTADHASICPEGTVQFTDASLGTPSSYAWTFEGGVPATSTDPNPLVQYPAPGTYDVTLSVVTVDGPDVIVLPNYVTVYSLPLANAGVDAEVCAGSDQQLQASGGTTYQWFPATGLSNAAIANPIASSAETTSYTVLVTDANGCQNNDFMILTVHNLPTVVASAGNNTICLGDTANIIAVGAQVFTWSPNLFISSTGGASVDVWPTSDFTWTVLGSDLFGCVNDTTVTIEVQPPPPAPTATNIGMSVTSTTAVGYQWYVDGDLIAGATQQSWSPLVNGNYSVVITDANGCTSQSLPVYFGTVGISENDPTTLRAYPQPAGEVLMITNVNVGSVLRLFDTKGRVALFLRANTSGDVRMNVNALAPGTYLLEVREGATEQRISVLVE